MSQLMWSREKDDYGRTVHYLLDPHDTGHHTSASANGTTRMVEFTKSSVWELINELTVAANI